MSYQVEFKKEGRGGSITYLEGGESLQFEWEFDAQGIEIYVPTSYEWDKNFEGRGKAWAQGRRQEILERVAQEYCRQRAKKAKWRITDRWIYISFEKYRIFRLLDRLLGNNREE